MPAVVSSVEVARIGNAILLDWMTSEVPLEEPAIGSTNPNIQVDNNCMDDKLHLGMRAGSGDIKDESDERDERNAIETTIGR
jgi:hypothetical protein